jgi:hypothetical protein
LALPETLMLLRMFATSPRVPIPADVGDQSRGSSIVMTKSLLGGGGAAGAFEDWACAQAVLANSRQAKASEPGELRRSVIMVGREVVGRAVTHLGRRHDQLAGDQG